MVVQYVQACTVSLHPTPSTSPSPPHLAVVCLRVSARTLAERGVKHGSVGGGLVARRDVGSEQQKL